jgi:hypothetical protein
MLLLTHHLPQLINTDHLSLLEQSLLMNQLKLKKLERSEKDLKENLKKTQHVFSTIVELAQLFLYLQLVSAVPALAQAHLLLQLPLLHAILHQPTM